MDQAQLKVRRYKTYFVIYQIIILEIHTLGRGFHLSSFLTMLGKRNTDSARLIQQFYAGAYQPADIKIIPYIDQVINNGNSAFSWKSSIFSNRNSYQNNISNSNNKPLVLQPILKQNIYNNNDKKCIRISNISVYNVENQKT